MPIRGASPTVPLPKNWTKLVRSGVLHAIALAATALTAAWSKASTSRSPVRRRQAEMDRLRAEIALLAEELAVKDARWARLHARRRPHYGPVQRMRILQLRAARGWSVMQAAKRFLVTEETIMSWCRRLDEEGENALVRPQEPVNRFPDFVGYIVRYLKLICPSLGKVRIADMLARAGLLLSASTVRRMLERQPSKEDAAASMPVAARRKGLKAKYPNHIWHVDLTAIPTAAGFWVPWLPFAKPQSWPFCWWAAVALDQASRRVVGVALFGRRPNTKDVCAFLGRAIKVHAKPRYIISDQGTEFRTAFKSWCWGRSICPRTGAIGKHGSIAVIERFIRSMKSECTRRIIVPLRLDLMRNEMGYYASWYNEHRPHSALDGRTPLEVFAGSTAANQKARFEPRPRWPAKSDVAIKGRPGVRLTLVIGYVEKRAHLPVIELKRAA